MSFTICLSCGGFICSKHKYGSGIEDDVNDTDYVPGIDDYDSNEDSLSFEDHNRSDESKDNKKDM
jgi:hypothetical protein